MKKNSKRWAAWIAALLLAVCPALEGQMALTAQAEEAVQPQETDEAWCGLNYERSLALQYADQFSVDYYEGGYARIRIVNGGEYLVVPEGLETPEGLSPEVTVLHQPVQNIYLVATSAMDLFVALDALDCIRLSGTSADGWYIEEARAAMESGEILYAGKYSAPDYEQILAQGCTLAVESTMIYHSPEVKEKLESFGIPVLVEHSSYEQHPLGRTEWMKLYGVLLGREDLAEQVFCAQAGKVDALSGIENTEKTVAFFYISSNGYANVRKSGDYVAKMIELAGGRYLFNDLGDEEENALSTVNMELEEFYAKAREADYIIYNSTIDAELQTLDELIGKSALLADFRAVQEGNVWCTGKNLFQETSCLADMIADIHAMLTDEEGELTELTYLHRLR